jgi:hypothetical protein
VVTKTVKTVLLVVVGLVFFAFIGIVSFGVWFFTSALETAPADEARATRSVADVRARFANTEPLLRMTDQGPVWSRRPPQTSPSRDLQRVRFIGWSPDEQRLTEVTLPFWLLRMKEGPFSVSASSILPNVRVSVTATELERYGPALLFDHMDEDGSRVLIWTE